MKPLRLLLTAALFSQAALGIHAGKDLTVIVKETTQRKDPRASFYSLILQATGYVALIKTPPIREEAIGYTSMAFETAGCSAVYIQKPAYFVSLANCFADQEGKLDRHRRYGKVFVKNVGYLIDPVSIVIHENYGKTQEQSDLAVFSLEPKDAAEFEKNHTPIPVISEQAWNLEGELTHFVGLGAFSKDGEEFGFPRLKEFIQRYPDPEDIQAAGNKLNVGPQEHVLTYVTSDGSKGVNCQGDSGGGVFVESNDNASRSNTGVLQALILGKVGPDGNPGAPCETISKYAVAADLRYESQWIESAVTQSRGQIVSADSIAKANAALRKKLYGGRPGYDTWANISEQEIAEILTQRRPQNQHEQNAILYRFMQLEEARREARQHLAKASTVKVAFKQTKVEFKNKEPFEDSGTNWVVFGPGTWNAGFNISSTKSNEFINGVRITNVGTEPIEFQNPFTEHDAWGGRLWQKTFKLQPGEMVKLTLDAVDKQGIPPFKVSVVRLSPIGTSANMSPEKLNASLRVRARITPPVRVNYFEEQNYEAIRAQFVTMVDANQPLFKALQTARVDPNLAVYRNIYDQAFAIYQSKYQASEDYWSNSLMLHNRKWGTNHKSADRR